MEKAQVVEKPQNLKLDRTKGKEEINGTARRDKAGNLLLPVKVNGETKYMTAGQIKKLKKGKKVKFESNETSVDVSIADKKTIPKREVDLKQLSDALIDVDVEVIVDKQGYTNFKVNKRLITYAIDTKYGFMFAVRSSENKSGWKNQRCITKKDLDELIAWIKKQVENQKVIEISLLPFYRCNACQKFESTTKEEMIAHINKEH